MKIIFNTIAYDDELIKGGYVVQIMEDLFVATTFKKDQYGTHNKTFEYDNEKEAIEFAKTGVAPKLMDE